MTVNGNPSDAFAADRAAMVEQQLRRRGIHDPRVLEAMGKVPRHEFVAASEQPEAYSDRPIIIGEQQTTSQPYIIAAMLQAAEIKPEDRALEIGAGSGYQTALLAELASQVFAVERHPALADAARQLLERLQYTNVTVVAGDGSLGLPQEAPFDVIIVSAAAPQIPAALLDQLAPEGRLVVPVGDSYQQILQLARKQADGIKTTPLEGCRFVPLIGEQGFRE
ncbi:MAG TPA: protein-L-isoaspartate(D-aspartate) O-methyltransferase [Verrucomicrobiae bacterium]|jgi:protein-L-isoaspartate(D-aspartate) O-methyltransferase|nr:protein-L-isoaspartate(D-aspartate) O-methyltransferase [Verrucomicrobiae bacterium]